MTLYPTRPNRQPYPSGRSLHTDPLRREFGLRLRSRTPAGAAASAAHPPLAPSRPLRWQAGHPERGCASERSERECRGPAEAGARRQRPDEASLSSFPPSLLGVITLTELEVARRVVETPRASISRDTRNKLLRAQGTYLCCLYAALAAKIGESAALAEFERSLLKVV